MLFRRPHTHRVCGAGAPPALREAGGAPAPQFQRRQRHTRGIATFEFVLVFPILLMLVAALFLVARADTRKTLTATAARREAWDARARANPGQVLALSNDPATSAMVVTPTRDVERGPLFPRDTFTARSKLTATGHTWDYRDVKFDAGHTFMNPHLDELGKIAVGFTDLAGMADTVRQIIKQLVLP